MSLRLVRYSGYAFCTACRYYATINKKPFGARLCDRWHPCCAVQSYANRNFYSWAFEHWSSFIHQSRNDKQLGIKFRRLYWLIVRNFLLDKFIVKPIWTCRIQLWGSTISYSDIAIIHVFQSKNLITIVQASWYVTNKGIYYGYLNISLNKRRNKYIEWKITWKAYAH